MPALAVVHKQALKCATCGEPLATAGSRSPVTTDKGAIIVFDDADPPTQLSLSILCKNNHRVSPPISCELEMAALTPASAPKAEPAIALAGKTESGKDLTFPN